MFVTFEIQVNCCGATGFKDFKEGLKKTSNWPKTVEATISNHKLNKTFDMPVFCCKTNGTFPQLKIEDPNCMEEKSENNFKDKVLERLINLF